jgi:hypothetical protein
MVESDNNRSETFLKGFKGPCPVCNYHLNEPTSSRCPECGSRLSVQLLAPFHFYPWHALLIGIGVSFGVCFDRLLLIIHGYLGSNAQNLPWGFVGVSTFLILVLCVVGFVVWKYKTQLERMSKPKSCVWYAFSILIPIMTAVVQYYLIMMLFQGGL